MFLSFVQEYNWPIKLMIFFSGTSFLIFGFSCLFSEFMVIEFKRYHLQNFRILVGSLQLLGAFGLFLGFFFKSWAILASLGLGVLMILGFLVRLRIKDSFILAFPSLFYALLNMILFILLTKMDK